MRLVVAAVAAACVASVLAAAGAAAPPRGLPDCLGKLQVRPRQVVFACADAGFGADRLSWFGWGGARAVALGSAYVNDCTPNCAAGRFHRYRVVLIASGSQRCANDRLAYRTVEYDFVGRSPFPAGAPETTSPRETFRCR